MTNSEVPGRKMFFCGNLLGQLKFQILSLSSMYSILDAVTVYPDKCNSSTFHCRDKLFQLLVFSNTEDT